MDKIKDEYERPILSFRISITNRCNVNCLYCHHDGMLPSHKEMTPDEIYQITKIAKNLGIEKIRISGGEPLIRKDIVTIIKKMSTLNFKDISITTNGTLLEKYAKDLKEAGLNRINISLDSINRDTYKFITSKDYLEQVKKGIMAAIDAGLYPIKINMVIMKNINENEIKDMFKFSKKNGLILQLIELMTSENCEDGKFNDKYHCDIGPIEKEIAEISDRIKIREFMQDRKKYFIDDGEIEIVRPIENTQFCKKCTRLRLTPEGQIKPCLLRNDNLIDIINPLRENKSEEELEKIFIKGINKREPFYKD